MFDDYLLELGLAEGYADAWADPNMLRRDDDPNDDRINGIDASLPPFGQD